MITWRTIATITIAGLALACASEAKAQARQRGHRTVDGLGMLLQQAGFGFRKWFGGDPRVMPELRQIVEADILAKSSK